MVAPSKNLPKISVKTFAHKHARPRPGNGRVEADRRAAKAWSSVDETVADNFARLVRQNTVGLWYDALSPDEVDHWFLYFRDDIAKGGLAARRIPRQVTEELEAAIERDCFTGIDVLANLERRQFVLMGELDDGNDSKYYPIVAWYPTESPLPTPRELQEFSEAKVAAARRRAVEEGERREAENAQRRKDSEANEEQRRQAKRLIRVYWGIAWAVLGAMIVLTFFLSGERGFGSLLAALAGAWFVFEVNNGKVDTVAAVHRRLPVSLAALNLLVGLTLGAAVLL